MDLDVCIYDRIPYTDALSLQKELAAKRLAEEIPDTLLLLEHPSVITLGKRGTGSDIHLTREKLSDMGVGIVETDRGGQVTFHGPGQLVGYFICNMYSHQRQIRRFVERIEESIVRFLAEVWNIDSAPDAENIGVWSGGEKIAAVGISIHRGITTHGFALNISTDLSCFDWIVPCGITDRGVTSVKAVLEKRGEQLLRIDMPAVKTAFPSFARDVFGYKEMNVTQCDAH